MHKTLFDTKVKDGLALLAVVLVVMITSLSLDDLRGALKTGKVTVHVYVPSYEISQEGPVLKPGDPVKLYKTHVGRVSSVGFFVARVKKPPLSAGTTAVTTGTPRPWRPDLVTGMKITCELYEADFPAIMATLTTDSSGKIESPALGEPSLILTPTALGRPIESGSRIGFPKNNLDVVDPKDPSAIYAEELHDPAEIKKVRQEAASHLTAGGRVPAPPSSSKDDDL